MILIPGRGIVVKEKNLAMPSVGVGGETHEHRIKCADWARSKKIALGSSSAAISGIGLPCNVDKFVRQNVGEGKQKSHTIRH